LGIVSIYPPIMRLTLGAEYPLFIKTTRGIMKYICDK
jgi:hypothetical protein